ncbi:LysM peptidoglycan-binding domain-containing protein [Chloroflexia bacterium SDU3-3]|nr:LysM peptidoglycan-binding domain-containing protein [Chloroflexia bacterium SDU3-3]
MGLVKAKLTPMSAAQPPQPRDADAIEAQFNPSTLSLSYNASGSAGTQNGASADPAQNQQVQRTTLTSSLRFDLVFDTTESGEDVRNTTMKIAALLRPSSEQSPIVRFSWGTFLFNGTLTSLSETIDYFSDQGVPLRSSVQLAMAGTELSGNTAAGSGFAAGVGFSAGVSAGFSAGASAGFSAGISAGASAGVSAGFSAGVGTTPLTLAQAGDSIQGIAARAGADWKAVASANGIDNPRQVAAGTVLDVNARASAKISSE